MIRVDMPGSERPSSPASNACVVASCGRKVYGHGYCNAHYQRWKRSGDPQPDIPIRKVGATIEERFWSKVNKGSGCWEWLGYRHPFGHVTHNGQTYWLGTFGTREEAGAAAQAERNRLFTHNNDDRRTVA